MKAKISRVFLFAAYAVLLAPCVALADVDWTQFERTFNVKFRGYRGSAPLQDFPVLVRLSPELNDFKYSKCRLANGGDLRFSDAAGNLLPSEIDTWNPSGTSLVWVKVPSLSKGTTIKAFYGCANPPAVTASDVWTNGYLGVWHLGDANNATQKDSTTNGFDFICSDSHLSKVDLAVSSGAVGGAVGFNKDGSNQGALSAADSRDVLAGTDDLTVEAWICRTQEDLEKSRYIITKRATSGSAITYIVQMMQGGAPQMNISNSSTDNSVHYSTTRNDAPPAGAWTHMAFTRTGSNRELSEWLDGTNTFTKAQSTAEGPLYNQGGYSVYLGNSTLTASSAFIGNIDEVRISGVARSGDWVTATRDTVANADFAEYEMDNDWTRYSHKFTVSFNGYAGSTTLENFPVLIRVSESSPVGFKYADCQRENGIDLRFADGAGNILASEVETWNTNGTSCIWVKVPSLSSSTKITGYYGWNLAPKSEASEVWDSDYVAVWHMNAAADSFVQNDSTVNGCALELPATHSERIVRGVSGVVGCAAEFDKLNDKTGGYKYNDANGLFDGKDALTLELWTYQTEFTDTKRRMFRHRTPSSTGSTNVLEVSSVITDGRIEGNFYRILDNGDRDYVSICPSSKTEGAVPALSEWNYQAVRFDCGNNAIKGFMNGTAVLAKDNAKFANASTTAISDSEAISIRGAVFVGNLDAGAGTGAYHGMIDEIRFSKVARSDDWIVASHDTVSKVGFATYSHAEQTGLGFVIIVR